MLFFEKRLTELKCAKALAPPCAETGMAVTEGQKERTSELSPSEKVPGLFGSGGRHRRATRDGWLWSKAWRIDVERSECYHFG